MPPESGLGPVLGIHTADAGFSVALVDGADVLASHVEQPEGARSRHAELLGGAIDRIWNEARLPADRTVPVAVVVGPGSFTGVRTSLAWAKGYAMARQAPLVTLGTLEVLAFQSGRPGCVAVVQDARKGQVFAALFRMQEDVVEVLIAPECLSADDWLAKLAGFETIDPVTHVGPETLLDAVAVARLGALRLAAGGGNSPVTAHPEYLREASATPNWQAIAPPPGGGA
jgi:tRNA threonylcarbamoyl adenosine modification protein YeaZ